MPLTVRSSCSPVGVVIEIGEPTVRLWSSAKPSSTKAPSARSSEKTACEPSFHSRLIALPLLGVTARDERRLAVDEGLPRADARHLPDAGRLRGGLGGLDGDRGEVVLRGDRVVGDEDPVDGVRERRADALAEDGDERHQREPDHERRRGRGRALRVPLRVSAGELAGGAAHLGGGPAEGRRERRDELRGEERDADAFRVDSRVPAARAASRRGDGFATTLRCGGSLPAIRARWFANS